MYMQKTKQKNISSDFISLSRGLHQNRFKFDGVISATLKQWHRNNKLVITIPEIAPTKLPVSLKRVNLYENLIKSQPSVFN